MRPDKLAPMPDTVPERFELGTLPYELLAGTTAAIDFLAGLAPGNAAGSRRARLVASMTALEKHEAVLLDRLEEGLAAIPGRDPPTATRRGAAPRRRCSTSRAARRRSCTGAWPSAASTPRRARSTRWSAPKHLGLGTAGAVRAGIAPYTDESDVDRLLTGVAELAG